MVQNRANKLGIFIASAKKVYRFNKPISLKFSAVYSLSTKSCQAPIPCVPRLSSSGLAFAFEGKAVRNHGDKFAISGLALDVADRIAEELLQHLDIASVPSHFYGVADFQGFALKEEPLFLSVFFIVF